MSIFFLSWLHSISVCVHRNAQSNANTQSVEWCRVDTKYSAILKQRRKVLPQACLVLITWQRVIGREKDSWFLLISHPNLKFSDLAGGIDFEWEEHREVVLLWMMNENVWRQQLDTDVRWCGHSNWPGPKGICGWHAGALLGGFCDAYSPSASGRNGESDVEGECDLPHSYQPSSSFCSESARIEEKKQNNLVIRLMMGLLGGKTCWKSSKRFKVAVLTTLDRWCMG